MAKRILFKTSKGVITTRLIHIGDIFYLMGGSTKVKAVGDVDYHDVLCEILEASEKSKHKVGEKNHISRQILYPRRGQ